MLVLGLGEDQANASSEDQIVVLCSVYVWRLSPQVCLVGRNGSFLFEDQDWGLVKSGCAGLKGQVYPLYDEITETQPSWVLGQSQGLLPSSQLWEGGQWISCMLMNTQLSHIHVESLDETWLHGALKEPMITWLLSVESLDNPFPTSSFYLLYGTNVCGTTEAGGRRFMWNTQSQDLSFIQTSTYI